MKHLFQFLFVSALAGSILGCSGGPSLEPEIPDNPIQSAVQLRLKGHIASIAPSTRVNENGFVANDKVGVYVSSTNSLAMSGNTLDNAAFTYSSGNITAPAGKEVYWDSNDARLSVFAYYPYSESISSNAAYPFAVAIDQSTAADFYNSDFITAQATNLAPQTTPVNLTFNHSMSRINITLQAGEGITADELAAAEKSFSIGGLVAAGTINLATGTATAGATTASITPLENNEVSYSAIVYPQTNAVTFSLEIDEDIYTYTTDVELEAGYKYQFNLTLNTWESPEMTLSATTINPWEDGEETNGDFSTTLSFPDSAFKTFLLSADPGVKNDTGGYESSNSVIDADGDGEISMAEANAVCQLIIQDNSISDLTGLEYFKNLEYLVVTQASALTVVDVSKNSSIKYIDCMYATSVTTFKALNNPQLERLLIGYSNKLASVDISGATALTSLQVTSNPLLTTLDISHNVALKELNCSYGKFSTLDVSNNLALTKLDCNPMEDEDGNNLLATLYLATGQEIATLDKPEATVIEYK